MSKPLSLRQEQVLQATVHHYVDTMEPVGSRTLVQRFGIPASSATVRSAMGALERRGLPSTAHLRRTHSQSNGIQALRECAAAARHRRSTPGTELTGLSLRWAGLDDLLMHLARRLTDFTGLMSLITQPQQENRQLETIRLVPSGDRLLVMLVEANGSASHLNLRLPHGAEAELSAMERWAGDQLDQGKLNWEALPRQLQRSGAVLRKPLTNPPPPTPCPSWCMVSQSW